MATIDTDFMARVYDNLTQFWDYSLSHAGMELDLHYMVLRTDLHLAQWNPTLGNPPTC